VDGVTQFKWRRKATTQDTINDIAIPSTAVTAVYAYHPTSDILMEHLSSTKGVLSINFSTGKVELSTVETEMQVIQILCNY
jgi:hypothetical protein